MGSATLGVMTAALAVGAGLLAAPAQATATSDPCAAVVAQRGPVLKGNPLAPLTTGTVAIMSRQARVDLATLSAASARPWSASPSEVLWFRSLYWLASAAVAADAAGRTDLLTQVTTLVDRYARRSPDPGGADLDRAYTAGWDEGAVTRRTEALNCIYDLTRAPAVAAALGQLARANLDERRYYGPPLREPHNHGLMANQALWTSGELLGNARWVQQARARLTRDFDRSFSNAGVTIEGSTVYQFFLFPEWRRVAERLTASGAVTAGAAMTRRLQRVFTASRHMIRPDGVVMPIGDGFPATTTKWPPVAPGTPLVLADPTALYAARFAWNDRSSAYLTLRVGRTPGSHGHDDLGSVTWYATGVPVLADPGSFDYSSNPVTSWLKSRSAHNVPIAGRQRSATRSGYTAALGGHTQSARAGSVAARLQVGSDRATRVDRSLAYTRSTLSVGDAGTRLSGQRFTLDPRWRVVRSGRTAAVLADPAGARLTVTLARGDRLTVVRGRTSPRAGWVAPTWQTLVPAVQLQTSGTGRLRTTFRVSR